MKTTLAICAFALVGACSSEAFAQADATAVQRDVNQQDRIEQGLQSGQLTTREASQLERGEAGIDHMEARDLSKGPLTSQEQRQINNAQNRESNAIYQDKHNGITGNPNSVSSRRMQADVARDANQEKRIGQGIRSGQLNNRQVAGLERGQAHDDRLEARAGANGHVGAGAQARIQGAENRQSNRIYRAKH
jgi:hypothetical protein